MKKIIFMSLISFAAMQLNAQKFVSTSSQNKKVVLEEFTGIHCGYCPDGHKRGNDLVAANSGKVILVNIHSGGYAVPQTGEPDFRTTEGTTIDGNSSLSGYPAGQVNRVVPTSPMKSGGLAMDRGKWSGEASNIMGQSSPVNVAVKTSLDFAKRELTTEVEVYFTAAGPSSTAKLSVMLLEDNLLGPQSDYGNYNPTNWVTVAGKKLYRHNHVLRQMITSGGAYGETIDSTKKGYIFYKKYVTTIPAKYNNTDCRLSNLNVVAFVTENNNNILNGDEQKVDIPSNLKTDLGLTDLTSKPADLCFTVISPKVEVVNNLDAEIHSFNIDATFAGTSYTKSFSGVLKKGEKTTISWGNINVTPTGTYDLNIGGMTKINSDSLVDVDMTNDNVSISGLGFTPDAMSSFQTSLQGVLPAGCVLDKSQNTSFSIIPYYVNSSGGKLQCGARGTDGALRIPLNSAYSQAPAAIYFGGVDLTGVSSPSLTYYYAFQGSKSGAPKIDIEVSDDCGATWNNVSSKKCSLTGSAPQAGYWYIPNTDDYDQLLISLDSYKDKKILVRVVATPNGTNSMSGAALYIDEIELDALSNGIAEAKNVNNLSVYPNPSVNEATVSYSLKTADVVTLEVYDMLGQKVSSVINAEKLVSGDYKTKINTSNFPQGIYMITLKAGNQVTNQRLTVVK